MKVQGGRLLSFNEESIAAPPPLVSYNQLLRDARLATVVQQRETQCPRRVEVEESRFEEYDYYKRAGEVYRQRELVYAAAGATDKQIAEVGRVGRWKRSTYLQYWRPGPNHMLF